MRSIVGLVVAAGLMAAPSASAAPAPSARLAGSAVPFTRSLASTGPVPGIQRLTIQVWLAPRDPAGAARYAMAVSTPGRPLFHRFLSPDAYTARYGGTTAEAAAVTGWLRSAGFSQVTTQEHRSYVRATAAVSVIDAALGVRLRYYRATRAINAGHYRLYTNDRPIRVPAALAPRVLAVTGLDNEAPALPLVRPGTAASPTIRCSHHYGQHRGGHLPRKFGVTSFPTSICGYSAWEDSPPVTAAQRRLTHSIIVRAAAEGVGMYFSSGDGADVRSPAEDPFATGVGCTSLATPLVAGLVADAQQGHARFGFVNPVLYPLAGTRAFHDVLPVTRRSPARYRAVVCASGDRNCNFSGAGTLLNIFDDQPGPTGQVALRGYDNMTGLGSPDGQAFIAALRRLEH